MEKKDAEFIKLFGGCMLAVILGGLFTVAMVSWGNGTVAKRNEVTIKRIDKDQIDFSENFKLMCSSKDGFNKTLKQCEDADNYINQYHKDDLEHEGWMKRDKDNYNGYIWNVTPAAMIAYHRDAFVIWCMSDPVRSSVNGLGMTRNQCDYLYRCLGTKVKKKQGWSVNDDSCK